MITRHKYAEITWIDVDKPTLEDAAELTKEFGLHPILSEDLLSPSLRQKVDVYEDCLYLILHFPVPHHDRAHAIHEVDFVVGKNFIITARYDALDPLHHFSKAFQANAILERNPPGDHAGYILFYMLKKLYESTSIALSLIGERLGVAEEEIFNGNEQRMVRELSVIQRDVLMYHRSLRHHKGMLHSLSDAANKFFGQSFEHWTNELSGEYLKVEEKLEDRKEMINALRTTNDSLLAAKTNATMRSLTLASVPIFLATMVATFLISETSGSPIHGSKYDFWLIVGISLGTLALSYLVLQIKHKRANRH